MAKTARNSKEPKDRLKLKEELRSAVRSVERMDMVVPDLPTSDALFNRFSGHVKHQIRKVDEAHDLIEYERFRLTSALVRAADDTADRLKEWLRRDYGEELRFREDPKVPEWRTKTKKLRDMNERTQFNERFKVLQKECKRMWFKECKELREQYGLDKLVDEKGEKREWAFLPPNLKAKDLAVQWGVSRSEAYKFLRECRKHGFLVAMDKKLKDGKLLHAAGYWVRSGTDRHRIVWFLKQKSHKKTLPDFKIGP